MSNLRSLEIAKTLVAFDSVSSRSNAPVNRWIADFLAAHGFEIERIDYLDGEGIDKSNLVAKRSPSASSTAGGVCYMAHTDVVPADDWAADFCGPFEPTVRDSRLYGRGSCDMKGSLACALAAVELVNVEDQTAPIHFIITADEEISMVGAKQVARRSELFRAMVAADTIGIIGEPTELKVIHAHKGGQTFWISARGRSAHSSSRDGLNANHALIPVLPYLLELQARTETDEGLRNSDFDPPTLSWNMVLRNEPYATNVTPSLAEVAVFLRAMPGVDHGPLIQQAETLAKRFGLDFRCTEPAPPLFIEPDCESIVGMLDLTGEAKPGTVCYATDGCALRDLKKLVVCGPGSIHQAHRNNEWISLEQLELGTDLYRRAFQRWATT